jgi:hypothetical protein
MVTDCIIDLKWPGLELNLAADTLTKGIKQKINDLIPCM